MTPAPEEAIMAKTLSDKDLAFMNAYWRAAMAIVRRYGDGSMLEAAARAQCGLLPFCDR